MFPENKQLQGRNPSKVPIKGTDKRLQRLFWDHHTSRRFHSSHDCCQPVKVGVSEQTGLAHLEVAQDDEPGSTDPACGQTRGVEDAVLVLLDDVGVA